MSKYVDVNGVKYELLGFRKAEIGELYSKDAPPSKIRVYYPPKSNPNLKSSRYNFYVWRKVESTPLLMPRAPFKTTQPKIVQVQSKVPNNVEFCITWQAANSVLEVAEAFDITENAAIGRADYLRNHGVRLRKPEDFVDVSRLNEIINEE